MEALGYRQFVNRQLPPLERGCMTKVAYGSRAEARSFVRHGRHVSSALHPYRCRHCADWHLGHRSPKRRGRR
jgi:hypothetical protein